MIISNEIKTRKIEFIRIESVKEHYPMHRIQIKIETENIKTDFDNFIWISDTDIEKFLVKLDELDRVRKAQAILESMSPDEFKLIIQSIDNFGHLSVSLHFVKEDSIARDYSFDIKVEFQIDPTCLTTVRNDFLKLME